MIVVEVMELTFTPVVVFKGTFVAWFVILTTVWSVFWPGRKLEPVIVNWIGVFRYHVGVGVTALMVVSGGLNGECTGA